MAAFTFENYSIIFNEKEKGDSFSFSTERLNNIDHYSDWTTWTTHTHTHTHTSLYVYIKMNIERI